jgi:cell division septal protein FtsQ
MAGTWYMTRLPTFAISEVEVTGGEVITPAQIREVVEGELIGEYLRIIPHRFAYLYPHDAMVHAILDIPHVASVTVTRVNRQTLRVEFKEYLPYALWCHSREDNAPCYFVSDSGFAFAPAPLLQGGTLVRHIVEGRETLEKTELFNAEELKRIHNFIDELNQKLDLRISEVVHTKEGDLQFFIHGGGSVLVADTEAFEAVFQNLESVLSSKEFKHLKPGNFQYIDLRFGNKVFVNEEMSEPGSTTTPITVETASTTM